MYLQDLKLGAAVVIERAKSVKADYPKDFDYAGIFKKYAKKYGPRARQNALKSERGIDPNDPNHKVNVSRYRDLLKPFEKKCGCLQNHEHESSPSLARDKKQPAPVL